MNIVDISSIVSMLLGILGIIVLSIAGVYYIPNYIFKKKIGAIVLFLLFVINLLCIILPDVLKANYNSNHFSYQIVVLIALVIAFFIFAFYTPKKIITK
jgi:hypothetical protein